MSGSKEFKTEIYHRGVVMTLSWRDQHQLEQGKAFLDALTESPHVADDMYYLEDKQYEALLTFRQRLRQEQA